MYYSSSYLKRICLRPLVYPTVLLTQDPCIPPCFYTAAKQRLEQFSRRLKPEVDARGLTALHYATIVDDVRVAKILLEAGANPDSTSRQGYQPMHIADSAGIQNALDEARGTVRLDSECYQFAYL